MQRKAEGTATTVARQPSVLEGMKAFLMSKQVRHSHIRSHTVTGRAKSPLRQSVAMRLGVFIELLHEQTAQGHTNATAKHANAFMGVNLKYPQSGTDPRGRQRDR
eukprot:6186376-Pleurochrysis_carterae.AAC.4